MANKLRYDGFRRGTEVGVFVLSDNGTPEGSYDLLPHVVAHSPGGFEWGYGGSGPADLALSILADALGEKQTPEQAEAYDGETGCPRAWALHMAFARERIAGLADEAWSIGVLDVFDWVARAEKAHTKPARVSARDYTD